MIDNMRDIQIKKIALLGLLIISGFLLAVLSALYSFAVALGVLLGVLASIAIFVKPEMGLYFIAIVVPIGRFTVPGLPFFMTAADVLIILTMLSWLFRKLAYEKKYKMVNNNLFVFLGLFTIFSGLSIYNCIDKVGGTIEFIQTVEYFIIIPYICFDLIKSLRQIRIIAWLMALMSIPFALWGIYEAVILGGRAVSIAGHPNAFGIYLAMIIPLAYVLLLNENNKFAKLILTGALAISAFALMATISRAGWLAASISLVVINFIKGIKKTAILTLSIICLVALLVSFYLPDTVSQRFQTFTKPTSATTGGRLQQYKNALEMIKAHPFFGVGIDEAVRYNLYSEQEDLSQKGGGEIHNFYLSFAAERGLLAFISFITFVFLYLRRLYKLSNLKIPLISDYSLIFLGCSLSFLVGNMFHNSIGRGNGNLFMLIVGMALALNSIYKAEYVKT
ncbi:MAG: O-antigen ligase family protein [Candidatus Omnitrophica bacterium]|nr:O-antigen ligase family protein [Candidatus Omnitrophota bacterium]